MAGGTAETLAVAWGSVPFVLLAALLCGKVFLILLTRGNPLLRFSALACIGPGAAWAVAMALGIGSRDQLAAEIFYRGSSGLAVLVGPGLMLSMLALSGRFERHRKLLLAATLLSSAWCALVWTTDLVIAGVSRTGWGVWYITAGPLYPLYIATFVGCALSGMGLGRRGGAGRNRIVDLRLRRVAGLIALLILATSDALLAYGIGAFPFSFVPLTVVAVIAAIGIVRWDLLQARGFDRATAAELLILALFTALAARLQAAVTGIAAAQVPVLFAAALVPLFGVTQLGITAARQWIRVHTQRRSARAVAFDELAERLRSLRSEEELHKALGAFMGEHLGLRLPRLLVCDDDGVVRAAGDSEVLYSGMDERVRTWLAATGGPVLADELVARRLGELREPLRELLERLDADVIAPLVDGGKLIGALVAIAPETMRAMSEGQRQLLVELQDVAARSLSYLSLYREVQRRSAMDREVELVAALQNARATGRSVQRVGVWELVTHYQPGAEFGGDWYTAHELPDGRLLIAVSDVTGRGVPAALLSAAAMGAAESAQRLLGASFELVAFMELLGQVVRDVGATRYSMSCFAAVLDPGEMTVTFCNAGHPFPYLVRRGDRDQRAELQALVSRTGARLGSEMGPPLSVSSLRLVRDDVILFYSDSVPNATTVQGVAYGDRRLQRILRETPERSGAALCDRVVRDVVGFSGTITLPDDLIVITVQRS